MASKSRISTGEPPVTSIGSCAVQNRAICRCRSRSSSSCHQSQHRQGAWADRASGLARPRRRGDRLDVVFPAQPNRVPHPSARRFASRTRLIPRDASRSNAARIAVGSLKFDAYCLCNKTLRKKAMATQNELKIDSSHCRAICDEIGDRLRAMLDREPPAMPLRLQVLLNRLAEQDLDLAPSIAPSMDDMVWQPELVPDPMVSMHAA